jgi:hypothetical protein
MKSMLAINISAGAASLNNLLDTFRQSTSEADQLIQEALLNSSEENIVVVAKSLAPKKTGALRESIEARPGNTPLSVLIVADKYYASFLEYGTSRIPEGKYTFLSPAVSMQIDRVIEDVKDALLNKLEQ